MAPPPPASPPVDLTPLVWVVDDSPTEIEAIRRSLSSACRVEVFSNGEAMLEALHQHGPPDVLVLDWQMPGLSGLEVCRYLRGTPSTAMLPVLILTGHARPEDVEEALLAGANDYVLKPFQPAELLARVHALSRWELQRKRVLADERARRVLAEGSLTEVQAAEARARRSEQRYLLAARATRDVIWEWNTETDEVERSISLPAYLGYPDTGQTGDTQWWKEHLHPEDRERVVSGIRAAIAGTAQDWQEEYRLRRADGTWVFIVDRCHIVRDEEGRASQVVGALQDVTERKRLEAEARQRAEFERQLIGIVSHDLRNPLNAITLAATAILRSEELEERQRRNAVRVLTAADRATRMIRDLLDFTQARQGGGIPLNRQPMDLHELVHTVVDELQVIHSDRTIHVEQAGDGKGEWDPDRLMQVIGNLMGNALQYSPPNTPVKVTTRGEVDAVVLEVHNSGDPIEPDVLPRIFEPMERGSHLQAVRAGRSIGLGLFIVRHIVLAHGGRVSARSLADEGTTFTVLLPRHP
ncbi:hybrid sensor histidine kinase/response regulator [Hyalangium gracile]|uniref:hybrid sensor histidine kinase/response regulator n=1 Tax=Hyalangium gracile TaxID=394092 RepID=UPI001CCBEF04|nr:response regulator [Hyalangium gracile]